MSAKYQIKIGYRPAFNGKHHDHESLYTVISVKNTTEHLPGEILPRLTVDALCKSFAWDVTLVPLREQDA